jgi:hypothetical protein
MERGYKSAANWLRIGKTKQNPLLSYPVPSVGSCINIYENKYIPTFNKIVSKCLGIYHVTDYTNKLILCKKELGGGNLVNETFLISDFRSGVCLFNNISYENWEITESVSIS